jgi:GT2 family glycosyltransferase
MNVIVSVVVPTYRRPLLLERCLGALLRQNLARRYEVLVVDDAALDITRAQVRRWRGRFAARGAALRYLATPPGAHGPARARNLGWRAATAEIVAFTDDDCVPDPGWLRFGLPAFDDGATAVAGTIVMPLPRRPSDYERDAARLADAEFATANCFCRRAALAAVGGFDPRFTRAWREDSDLQFALLERGYRIARAPAAMVLHPIRPEPWHISLRQVRKTEDEALLYKKHPRLYRARILPQRTLLYYGIVAGLVAALAGVGLQQGWLAAGGLGAWLGFSAAFFGKRVRGTQRSPAHVAAMLLTSLLIPPLSIYYRLKGAIRHRVLLY